MGSMHANTVDEREWILERMKTEQMRVIDKWGKEVDQTAELLETQFEHLDACFKR